MGKGSSKQVEDEQININVPVNSPKLAGDHYEVHQYHGGTVKAILVIILVIFMAIVLCIIAVKKLCRNMRYIGTMQATPTMVQAAPTVAYTSKSRLPDI